MDIKRYLEQASICYNTKNYEKAEEYLKKVIELDSKCKDGYRELAKIYEEKKEYEKAINCYKYLVELEPDDMDNYMKITELEKNIENNPSEIKESKMEGETEAPKVEKKKEMDSSKVEKNIEKPSNESITISKNKLFLIIAFVALGGLIIFGVRENNKRHHDTPVAVSETTATTDYSNTVGYNNQQIDVSGIDENIGENTEEETIENEKEVKNNNDEPKREVTEDGLEVINYKDGTKEYIKYIGKIPKDKYGKCTYRFTYVNSITDEKGRNITVYKPKSTAQCDEESVYLRYYYPELNKENPLKDFESYDDPELGMWLDEPIEKKRQDMYTSYVEGLKDGSAKRNRELEKELAKHNLYCSPKNNDTGKSKKEEKEPTAAELNRAERDAAREEALESLREMERAKGKKVKETTSYNPTPEEAEKVENYMRTGSFDGEEY